MPARPVPSLIRVILTVGSWTPRISIVGLPVYLWPSIPIRLDPTALLPLPMPINRHLRFFIFFIILYSHPLRKKTRPYCFILHGRTSTLLCSRYCLVASLWPAEGSRWTSGSTGFCFGEAAGIGDEVGGWTGRSPGCEVRIAPLGGLAEDMLSSTTQY